jgi:hypothetical protein
MQKQNSIFEFFFAFFFFLIRLILQHNSFPSWWFYVGGNLSTKVPKDRGHNLACRVLDFKLLWGWRTLIFPLHGFLFALRIIVMNPCFIASDLYNFFLLSFTELQKLLRSFNSTLFIERRQQKLWQVNVQPELNSDNFVTVFRQFRNMRKIQFLFFIASFIVRYLLYQLALVHC